MSKIKEDDGTDPLTLTNMILAHTMKNQGFNWVHQAKVEKPIEAIFDDAIEQAGLEGEFETDPPVPVIEAVEVPREEINNKYPWMVSTDQKFNPCPAYLEGICRIDGRPCPYSSFDYRECGKFFLATSGEPELFEIPPGREKEQEYVSGIKS